MSAHGKFEVIPQTLSDKSVVFDIWFIEPDQTGLRVYAALDETDAQMRCERLNAAIVEDA